MLYKDACNMKSNQRNLGTIKCSNLCTEIIEYTAKDEVAVCNLASIVLPKFVYPVSESNPSSPLPSRAVVYNVPLTPTKDVVAEAVADVVTVTETEAEATVQGDAKAISASATSSGGFVFDHQRLYEVTKVITKNLNKIIDINYYPIPEAKNSNFRHRPIGMGVQGLADAFQLMKLSFDSPEARRLNVDIFETIYFAALDASCELAEKKGTYESYPDSPVSKGSVGHDIVVHQCTHSLTHSLTHTLPLLTHTHSLSHTLPPSLYSTSHHITSYHMTGILQHDMWGVKGNDRWNWADLRQRISTHGVRNSLLIAPMPTASTAQVGRNLYMTRDTRRIFVTTPTVELKFDFLVNMILILILTQLISSNLLSSFNLGVNRFLVTTNASSRTLLICTFGGCGQGSSSLLILTY